MGPATADLSYLSGKQIIVAGAGIAGLSFALSLHKVWPEGAAPIPSIRIFERDSRDERLGREGYTLSVRSDGDRGGGVQVLDDLGLYEAAANAAVVADTNSGKRDLTGEVQSGRMILWDRNWQPLLKLHSFNLKNNTKRKLSGMRIRRNALQQVLADAAEDLPNVQIFWNKAAVSVTKDAASRRLVVSFTDGSAEDCDIIIAADGSSSKVRKNVRPDDDLTFRQIVMLSGTAKFASQDQIPGNMARDWGAVLSGTGKGMFVAPVDETSVLWSVSYKSPTPRETSTAEHSRQDGLDLLEEARSLGHFAGEPLQKLLDATDPSAVKVFNARDRFPFSHDLQKHGSVIWLGDSNHAVTPFAGNGANMAMIDSWDLVKALVSSTSLETAVQAFDKTMIPRMNAVLHDSHRNISIGHAEGWRWTMYWCILKIVSFFI